MGAVLDAGCDGGGAGFYRDPLCDPPRFRIVPGAMRARRIGRTLRFAAPTLAAASVAAAGGSVVAPAGIGKHPCDDGALGTAVPRGVAPLPCVETAPQSP